MSECNGCYQGCRDIISDQCVKYTGNDIAFLGIEKGDPLSEVEEKITTYLQTVASGTGVVPQLPSTICSLVSDYLSGLTTITLNDVLAALIHAACELQDSLESVETSIETIEAPYSLSCITGVTPTSGTHSILQAVIVQVCAISQNVTALYAALATYVKIEDINTYIEDYLTTTDNALLSSKMYHKMVPYTAVEFYGNIAGKFDATGKGIGDWEQVYLCNGENGTPDKRGRIPIGCTAMGSSTALDPEVEVGVNPAYNIPKIKYGTNRVYITNNNLPSHSHTATSTVTDPGHKHIFGGDQGLQTFGGFSSYGGSMGFDLESGGGSSYYFYTKDEDNSNNPQKTGVTVDTVITATTAGGQALQTIPPVISCYYIMYIPD